MARGGRREGAGRPKGSRNKPSKAREEILAREGELPLEVMLSSMRQAWADGNRELACRFARDAAPYVHPKLQAVAHTGKDGKGLVVETPPRDVARVVLALFRDLWRVDPEMCVGVIKGSIGIDNDDTDDDLGEPVLPGCPPR